jgi:hypothetical protein
MSVCSYMGRRTVVFVCVVASPQRSEFFPLGNTHFFGFVDVGNSKLVVHTSRAIVFLSCRSFLEPLNETACL